MCRAQGVNTEDQWPISPVSTQQTLEKIHKDTANNDWVCLFIAIVIGNLENPLVSSPSGHTSEENPRALVSTFQPLHLRSLSQHNLFNLRSFEINEPAAVFQKQKKRIVPVKLIHTSTNNRVPPTGYNRQGLPKRCALKVDLRKAYDTVEWDFLIAALQLFGFPDFFIGWIEECVTTPMFSVCINGNPHGFFKGARGLRTGGSDVPVLADVASIQVFRRGLEEFANLSGLHANPQKSQLIISRSAQEEREHLIAALQFQEGHLPLRGHSGSRETDAKFLVERKLDSGVSKGGME
ncbi:hypothetical protein Sango_3010700 [Sesamum angolense]|uniref:Reverse transcriptase domain-containing protein n=1 Tax=Sesamum angolense TaxID=2727404 RepID=A0AAE1T3R2_9LAMI|nr:hypothetical protein Sango_3010700 [Sesamum angolense]